MEIVSVILSSRSPVYNNLHEKILSEHCPNIKVVAKVTEIEAMLSEIRTHKPDAVELSLNIDDMHTKDLFGVIKENFPNLRIIVTAEMFYYECLKTYFLMRGAHAFLHTNCFGDKFELFAKAISSPYGSAGITCSHSPGEYYHSLSNSTLEFSLDEYSLIPLILQELSIKDISSKLNISEKKVRDSRQIILEKVGAETKLQFCCRAPKHGLHHISHDPAKIKLRSLESLQA